MSYKDYKNEAVKFWKEIYPSIEIPEELMNELKDFYFMIKEVPKVYMHITGNQLSKPHYYASSVISVADEYSGKENEECIKDELQMILDEIGVDYNEDWDYNRLHEEIVNKFNEKETV